MAMVLVIASCETQLVTCIKMAKTKKILHINANLERNKSQRIETYIIDQTIHPDLILKIGN
jgi:hypothetical protein